MPTIWRAIPKGENIDWVHFKGTNYNVVAPVSEYHVYLPIVLRNAP
jgi:hypothetical protein